MEDQRYPQYAANKPIIFLFALYTLAPSRLREPYLNTQTSVQLKENARKDAKARRILKFDCEFHDPGITGTNLISRRSNSPPFSKLLAGLKTNFLRPAGSDIVPIFSFLNVSQDPVGLTFPVS